MQGLHTRKEFRVVCYQGKKGEADIAVMLIIIIYASNEMR
jgi:hypothetical protein